MISVERQNEYLFQDDETVFDLLTPAKIENTGFQTGTMVYFEYCFNPQQTRVKKGLITAKIPGNRSFGQEHPLFGGRPTDEMLARSGPTG